MKPAEMRKMVYDRYPVTKKEKTCEIEKQRMNGLRNEYRKRIMESRKEKKEYS